MTTSAHSPMTAAAEQIAPAYTGLKFLMTFNQLAIERAKCLPKMMHMNIKSLQIKPEMDLFNHYQFHFRHVCRAFIKKYHNENNNFTRTTIAHSSMIDNDKFQIVRRMENPLTSKPLFERIIFDRKQMKMQGFTFEDKVDTHYFETYSY